MLKDNSVDVVTVRSVLIYVQEKQNAFREFHRVLKPEGRLSIFQALTPGEAGQLIDHLRPAVEAGRGTVRGASVFLWAVKH